MSKEQTKYKTEPSGNTRELNPISPEQREEIVKRIMQIDAFADTEECNFPPFECDDEQQNALDEWLESFVKYMTDHVRGVLEEELEPILLSSEQAWRAEATKAQKGVPTGEYTVLSDGVEVEIYKDPLIVISQLREQLNKAVEVLKDCQYQLQQSNHPAGLGMFASITTFLSSLSKEGDKKGMFNYFVSYMYKNGNSLGFGHIGINRETEIISMNDIESIRDTLEQGKEPQSIVILNYQLLSQGTEGAK